MKTAISPTDNKALSFAIHNELNVYPSPTWKGGALKELRKRAISIAGSFVPRGKHIINNGWSSTHIHKDLN